MNRKLENGLMASLLVWPVIAAAIIGCFATLPVGDPVDDLLSDPGHNWFGQGAAACYVNGIALILVIYGVKFFISRLAVQWVRGYFFSLLVVASLPYIWLLVVMDWKNMHVFPISCWLYVPMGIWFIPALSFAADNAAMGRPPLTRYLGRSCLELALMVPWIYIWVFISFFCLGGGWI